MASAKRVHTPLRFATFAPMAAKEQTSFHVRTSPKDAFDTVMGAMPDDAVVRGEDDGVGRFAGERILCIVGRNGDALMLFEGTWGDVKRRLEDPMLLVEFKPAQGGGAEVCLTSEASSTPGGSALVTGFLANAATVACLVVAFYWWRGDPIDVTRAAIISVGGGALWSAVGQFFPGAEDASLTGLVNGALSEHTDSPADSRSAGEAADASDG
jgi:hypothetical protein